MEISGIKFKKDKRRHFASDNNAGIHPQILKAMIAANQGHTLGYGHDAYTESAIKKFQEHFGKKIEVFFVFNGTAANVLGIRAVTQSYQSVICAAPTHLNVAECGAMENFGGNKLLLIPTANGKITVKDIKEQLQPGRGDQHHAQAKVVSIAQTTDLGAVYNAGEIKEIARFCHQNNLLLHMDGTRLANACAALKCSLKELTADVGVDILSFGGTKNGLMLGEAVIFFQRNQARDFKYIRKQGMQLYSKMRFIAVQFEALLSQQLWYKNAQHANAMAKELESRLQQIPALAITRQVESNMVYCQIPKKIIPRLWRKYLFHVYDEERSEIRLVASFDTTLQDVQGFVRALKTLLN